MLTLTLPLCDSAGDADILGDTDGEPERDALPVALIVVVAEGHWLPLPDDESVGDTVTVAHTEDDTESVADAHDDAEAEPDILALAVSDGVELPTAEGD